jgi:hypothetical protein
MPKVSKYARELKRRYTNTQRDQAAVIDMEDEDDVVPTTCPGGDEGIKKLQDMEMKMTNSQRREIGAEMKVA